MYIDYVLQLRIIVIRASRELREYCAMRYVAREQNNRRENNKLDDSIP